MSIALASTKQFADKVRIRLIRQLINGISRVQQNIANVLMVLFFLKSLIPSFPV